MSFFAFIKKEFLHILRDKRTMLILFGMPIIQIIIFGFALTNEIKNSPIAIWDADQTTMSYKLVNQISNSSFFDYIHGAKNLKEIEDLFFKGKIKMAIVIPNNFSKNYTQNSHSEIQLIADATNPNTANTITNYALNIIQDYRASLDQINLPFTIHVESRMLYNPQLKGAYNFVPGVMAMVLLLLCTMMTALTIVREKEFGSMEVLLVSPLKPYLIILAKSIPYLVMSIINIISILVLSVFVLELSIKGSLVLLMGISILFTVVSLALGLLISTLTDSQESAIIISLVALLLPTVLLSGFMFPIENMPIILQIVSNIIPAKWYYIMVKSVMLQGLSFKYIYKETLILFGMMSLFLIFAIRLFKLRVE